MLRACSRVKIKDEHRKLFILKKHKNLRYLSLKEQGGNT